MHPIVWRCITPDEFFRLTSISFELRKASLQREQLKKRFISAREKLNQAKRAEQKHRFLSPDEMKLISFQIRTGSITKLSAAPLMPYGYLYQETPELQPRFVSDRQFSNCLLDTPLKENVRAICEDLILRIVEEFQNMKVAFIDGHWIEMDPMPLTRYEIYLRVVTVICCSDQGIKYHQLLTGMDWLLKKLTHEGKLEYFNGIFGIEKI